MLVKCERTYEYCHRLRFCICWERSGGISMNIGSAGALASSAASSTGAASAAFFAGTCFPFAYSFVSSSGFGIERGDMDIVRLSRLRYVK